MDNKKIGLFIASLRKNKNMTQKELADKLYISYQAVSKWERGLSMPDIGLIEKLSSYLEISVSEILKGESIDNSTKTNSYKNVKANVSFRKIFKSKIILIMSIITASIVILGIIFYIIGTVDYIKAINGKKPIFAYHTEKVSHKEAFKQGTEYYGIGYKITTCDDKTDNYIFQLGHKQKNLCYSSLSCTEDEMGTLTLIDESTVGYVTNNKHSYDFSFFEDKLYFINSTFLIPTSSIENEETWPKEMLNYLDVPGVNTSIKKIDETTYEIKQSCNMPEILKAGFKNICSIDYFGEEIFGLTKNDIDNYYYKNSCK